MRWKNEDPARRAEYGRRGGVAARGKAHRFTPEEAQKAGRKGGPACAEKRRCPKCGSVRAQGLKGEAHECRAASEVSR
jgi:general stress protein YciG